MLVPALDEAAFIGVCLDSILAQDEPNLQVVVVDGGSADATVDIALDHARRDPRVELVRAGSPGSRSTIPAALNAGLGAARGAWLVRVDAHSTVPPDYVRRAAQHLRTGGWGGVGGRKDGVGDTPAGEAIGAALGSRFGVGDSVYHYGTSVRTVDHIPFGAYPTGVLLELGGWDERLVVANEDYELDYRIRQQGRRLLFDPGLSIAWYTRQSIPDLFRQYRRYGRGKADVARLHPDSLRPRHLAPPALVAWLAVAAVAGVWKPRLGVAALAPYAVGLAAASVATARGVRGRRARVLVPAAFTAMHLGWGLGFWEGMLDGAKRRVGALGGR